MIATATAIIALPITAIVMADGITATVIKVDANAAATAAHPVGHTAIK